MKIIIHIKVKIKCYRHMQDEEVLTRYLCGDSYQLLQSFFMYALQGHKPHVNHAVLYFQLDFLPWVHTAHSFQQQVLPEELLEASYDAKIKEAEHVSAVWWIMHTFTFPQQWHTLWMSNTTVHKPQKSLSCTPMGASSTPEHSQEMVTVIIAFQSVLYFTGSVFCL